MPVNYSHQRIRQSDFILRITVPPIGSVCSLTTFALCFAATMKHEIVHFFQKYVLNPPIKMLFVLGIFPPGYALLETIGRKTGKPRRTPVGNGLVGKQFWLVAEHGMKAYYVRNIAKNPHVRVKLRQGLHSRWHSGTASLLRDDNPRERQRWLSQQHPGSASNAAAVRLFGTELLTVRIDFEP